MKVSKGKAGGIGTILVGVGMLINGFVNGDFKDAPEALAMITAGLGIFGIRVGMEK